MDLWILIIVLIVFVVLIVIKNIRIVPQSQAYILERLGGYLTTWQVGLHVKLPFLDRVVNKVSLKERVLDFKPSKKSKIISFNGSLY